MSAYKIFISSPGDVGRERHLAEQVIRRVAAEFQDRVEVQPYFWEYEPMESTRDYQENIPLTSDFDLVICILWKRLGSPLSVKHERPGGGRWRSGTEFELVTAVESKKARGAPDIFIFKNDTKPTFEADEEGEGAKTEADLAQWKALIAFIKEWCEREQDGQPVFTAALNKYKALDQFEQVLEKLLVGKLNERFPRGFEPSGSELKSLRPPAPTWTEGSPFRGLEAFLFPHAPVFCGRTHAIGEVLDRLRRKAALGRPFVLILGASGSGKSSLAMAGVLPLLVKPGTIEGVGLWRRVVFRPGGQTEVGDLFDRLAAALVRQHQEGEGLPELISGSTTVEQLAADLRADPKAAALLVRSALNQVAVLCCEAEAQKLRSWIAESQAENRTTDVERYGRLLADLTPREARLALVIDQAEELFTSDDLNRRPELRKGFAVTLDALAASGVVFVLMTLRSDFYSQIQQLPGFVDLKEAVGQFDLLPAQPAEIAQIIRQPAIAAGLRFEKDLQTQEGLDEVLADQVKAELRLLPLLEFALDELYKQRSADGLLTFEAYRVHLDGSIVRALAKRADATLEGLPELSRDAFRSVMRRLATAVGDTAAGSAKGPQLDVIEKDSSGPAFQRQRVLYDQLTAYPPGAKALVDAFVAARLLVVEKGKADDQAAEVTVAHEALFERWAALKNLLLAERDDLILPRARVAASHERWRAENRAPDFLLPPGKQLSEAEQLLAEYGEELTPELKDYVAASMAQAHAQQKRRQRLLVGALIVFALLAVGASASAIFGFLQNRQLESLLEEAARSDQLVAQEKLQGGMDAEALAHLARAYRYVPKSSLVAEAAIPAVLSPPIQHSKTTFQGHTDSVNSAVFSPDGRRVLTASRDNTARLWEAESGKLLATFKGYGDSVNNAVFSSDGRRVLATSRYKTAALWEAESGKLLTTFKGYSDSVNSAVFSPDGRHVLTPSYDTAGLWEAESGKLLTIFKAHTAVFSPDGRHVLTASGDNTAELWEADSAKLLTAFKGHTGYVSSAVFSPDGRRVLTASEDKTAGLWEADSGKLLATFHGPTGGVSRPVFSPDGHRMLTVSRGDKTAELWEADSGKLLATFQSPTFRKGQTDEVSSAVFSPDGRRVLTRSTYTAQLCEAESGKVLGTFHSPFTPLSSAVFSPDGRRVLTVGLDSFSGSWGKVTRLWDSDSGKLLATFEGASLKGYSGAISSAVFSPDGRRVLTASADKTARLWDADSGKLLATFQGHTGGVTSAVFSPDGRRVLTASADKTAALWEADSDEFLATFYEAESGKLVTTFQGHSAPVPSVAWSPDGRRVFTAYGDETARIWEAESGKLLVTFQGHTGGVTSAVFSPDGRRVLTASEDYTARLWEAESGKLLATFQGHTKRVTSTSVVFSPDGRRVLTASEDYTARLWEAESGKLLATCQGDNGDFSGAVFSPDGRRVLTASAGNTARLWEADSGRLLATFQAHIGDVSNAVFSAVFSPDGSRVLTASGDKIARLWPVLPAGVPPPDWCGDFLVWLGGKRIALDGQIETLSGDELLKLEAQLRAHMNEDTDYARLLRWRLLPSEKRPVDPYGTITVEQAADLIIRPGMDSDEAQHAYDLDPWHPLVHLALARFEKDPIRADFLRRYSVERLPNDPKLRQRAAEFLRKQGKEHLPREMEARGE